MARPMAPSRRIARPESEPCMPTESEPCRRVDRVVRGLPASDGAGAGAGVRMLRVIGQPQLRSLDPFLMLDAFGSDDPVDSVLVDGARVRARARPAAASSAWPAGRLGSRSSGTARS